MFIYKKWDGKSPVGKLTDPDKVREHFGLDKNHVAYFVYDEDGNLKYFQYLDKFTGKKMTEDTWEAVAKKHVEELIKAHQRIKLAQETGTEKVEVLVEKRFLNDIEAHHEALRKNNPVKITADEVPHAKELGVHYQVVSKLTDRQPVVVSSAVRTLREEVKNALGI